MASDLEIKQMFKEKIKRFDARDAGMAVGAALHDAVAISTAKLGKEKASLVTKENYQEEITFWLDWLLQLAQEKKDYLSMPVVEETVIPIIEEPVGQKEYNKRSGMEEIIKEEREGNVPF